MTFSSYFQTPYGAGVLFASESGVIKVEIPDMGSENQISVSEFQMPMESALTVAAAKLLESYYKGEHIDFKGIPVVLTGITPFRQTVLNTVRKVLHYGEISTYSQIAEQCGSSGAARAVGGALAANPIPIIIPCHRIVASDGKLSGFSAAGGNRTKKALLEMEGVEFKGSLVVKKQLDMNSNW